MNLMILYGKSQDRNVRELIRESKRLGHKVVVSRVADISAQVDGREMSFWHSRRKLEKPELCFVRGLGPGVDEAIAKRMAVLFQMELCGARVINPVNSIFLARNKYATACCLARRGLPVAPTFITESSLEAYRVTRRLGNVVYKPLIGSMGYGSLLMRDADLAYNAYRTLEGIGKPIQLQAYVPNRAGDMRVFVIGREPVAAMGRTAHEKGWKTNIAQGGKAKAIDLPSEIAEMAVRSTEALGLEYAGVDLIENESGRVCVLEVNACPSWQALKKIAKLNIAKKIVEYAVESQNR